MKETDIRPRDLIDKYHQLSIEDANAMDTSIFLGIQCPGCLNKSKRIKFHKNRFKYIQCDCCGSLYCSPRPSDEQLNLFYINSKSAHYWATVFFPSVAEVRREKLFKPKAEKVKKLLSNNLIGTNPLICDVGAGYGLFLEELRKVYPSAKFFAIEPSQALSRECSKRGFETLNTTLEKAKDWHEKFDFVISSEVIEHVFSPEDFVRSLFHLTKPGGKVLMTGLGYEGFDILTLQKASNSISPPHHINFLSILGFEKLFNRIGFKKVEIWTPGVPPCVRIDVASIENLKTGGIEVILYGIPYRNERGCAKKSANE